MFGAVNVNYDRTKGFEGNAYYGETHLRLRPEVRQRSYFTFGDRGPSRTGVVDLISIPRDGLPADVRARVTAFASAHGIRLVEWGRTQWPPV